MIIFSNFNLFNFHHYKITHTHTPHTPTHPHPNIKRIQLWKEIEEVQLEAI